MNYVSTSNEFKEFRIASIDDPTAIEKLRSSFSLIDPPWRNVHYWCRRGDFTLTLKNAENEDITSVDIVNAGAAILWRKHTNTDKHTSQKFQKALVHSILDAIPPDSGLSLPEDESRLMTIAISLLPCEETVTRLVEKSKNVGREHREMIAMRLGSPLLPETAVEALIELAEDPDPGVRETAIQSLHNFQHIPAAQSFLQKH